MTRDAAQRDAAGTGPTAGSPRPVTVRLYPLPWEHWRLQGLDYLVLVAAVIIFEVTTQLGVTQAVLAGLGVAVVAHAIAMLLAADRFDAAGITIIRPWRRRRVAWSEIGGLVYVSRKAATGGANEGGVAGKPQTMYLLRLVLAAEAARMDEYNAKLFRGPVVMITSRLPAGLQTSNYPGRRLLTAQREERVLALLEQYGLARPEELFLPALRGEEAADPAAG